MKLKIELLEKGFGAKIYGFDGQNACDTDANLIRNELYKNRILILKNQSMNEKEYIQFSKKIGKPVLFVDPEYQHPDYPEIFVVSNMQKGKKKIGKDRVGYYWHSDSSFLNTPLPITMLYAQCVPECGGETVFINMHDIYATLSEEIKTQLQGKKARHEGKWRYIITGNDAGLSIQEVLERDEALVPSSIHPVIITHHFTQEKVLYVNEGFTKRILDFSHEQSEKILAHLYERVNTCKNPYKHHWEKGDVVLWDNRSVIHKAFPAAKGQDRMMFRIGINDGYFYSEKNERNA